jgi:hypothetical protein
MFSPIGSHQVFNRGSSLLLNISNHTTEYNLTLNHNNTNQSSGESPKTSTLQMNKFLNLNFPREKAKADYDAPNEFSSGYNIRFSEIMILMVILLIWVFSLRKLIKNFDKLRTTNYRDINYRYRNSATAISPHHPSITVQHHSVRSTNVNEAYSQLDAINGKHPMVNFAF